MLYIYISLFFLCFQVTSHLELPPPSFSSFCSHHHILHFIGVYVGLISHLFITRICDCFLLNSKVLFHSYILSIPFYNYSQYSWYLIFLNNSASSAHMHIIYIATLLVPSLNPAPLHHHPFLNQNCLSLYIFSFPRYSIYCFLVSLIYFIHILFKDTGL